MEKSSKPKAPPIFLVKMIMGLVEFLKRLQRKLLPPEAVLMDHTISDIVKVRCVHLAAELGIADLLKDGPKNAEQLAKETSTDVGALYRVMRTLTSAGIFKANKKGEFETNRLGRNLQTDDPNTLSHFIRTAGSEWIHVIWGDLLSSVKNGKSYYENNRGVHFFDWLRLKDNQEAQKIFSEGMTSVSILSDIPVVSAYNFSRFQTIADIGGGRGSQLVTILNAVPGARGFLFDLQHSIENVKDSIYQQEGMAGRLECIGGDFFRFDSIPKKCDAYVMKSIMPDFDDDRALKILANIRKAMRDDSTLILVECMINYDDNTPEFGKLLDVNELALMGGQVRTKAELDCLLEKTGFKLKRTFPTASIFTIVEAKPV